MKKRSGFYPLVGVDAAGSQVVSQAGGVVLVETVRVVGLDRSLAAALAPWRKSAAVHDPAKVVLDLALALGGDCLAGPPRVFRTVAKRVSYAACRFRYSSWTSCGVL